MQHLIKLLIVIVLFSSCGSLSNGRIRLRKVQNETKEFSESVNQPTREKGKKGLLINKHELTAVNNTPTTIDSDYNQADQASITNEYNPVQEESITNTLISPVSHHQKKNASNDEDDQVLDERIAKRALKAGILSFIPVAGIVFSIISFIIGLNAIYKIRTRPDQYGGRKMAVLGIILGGTALMIGVAIVILIFSIGIF